MFVSIRAKVWRSLLKTLQDSIYRNSVAYYGGRVGDGKA